MEIPKIRPSMRSSWRSCPRKVYYRTVGGIEPARGKRPLVIGTAYHYGLETWRQTKDPVTAAAAARKLYRELCAAQRVVFDPACEVQVGVYVAGYAKAFPIDGHATLEEVPVFDDADAEGGTADSVMRLPNGDIYVVEDKTTSRFDDADAMGYALKMNDQIATYVWALRERGIPVKGAFYRQVLKTGTSITKKETAADYEERLTGIYLEPEDGAAKYREFEVTWTPEHLRRVRNEANATSMAIIGSLESPVEQWPFNPLSCIGPYGPCEYIRLCARGRDAAEREFKPTTEGPLDHGDLHSKIWGSGQTATPIGVRAGEDGGAGLGALPDFLRD
jgi:hypothetical protein